VSGGRAATFCLIFPQTPLKVINTSSPPSIHLTETAEKMLVQAERMRKPVTDERQFDSFHVCVLHLHVLSPPAPQIKFNQNSPDHSNWTNFNRRVEPSVATASINCQRQHFTSEPLKWPEERGRSCRFERRNGSNALRRETASHLALLRFRTPKQRIMFPTSRVIGVLHSFWTRPLRLGGLCCLLAAGYQGVT
jgi:hypothetical protein